MAEPHSVLRFPDGSVSRQPLLTTKFQVPPPPRTLVWRDRLIARLDDASARKLTVVTAPAGFGKTTLLTTWIARTQHLTVWVSLDEADNDPARFWEYVIAALQGASHGGGDQALAMLRAPRALRIEAVLTTLIAALAATEEDVVLVLDDYQHITTQAIHGAVALLLDHLPPRVHLVIASRMQPPLPLSRLRVRDQLLELDAADLRFTAEEATAFLLQAAGPHLSHEIAATLWTRTEGWIAALQLAALVLRGCSDSAMFVSTFSGSHRYVADYLTEEVLLRQPEDVQWFLSSTSILDRLSGPLCEAVSGQSGGQALLERLERDNLFVLPLDEERRWYRYHPLFAEALRGRLRQTQPDLVASLHVRAADWFERHGLLDEALPHTLAAHEFARATQIIAQAALPMLDHGRWATLRTWIAALPEGLVRSHAHLTLLEAWVLLLAEDYDAVEPRLRQTEALLRRGAEVADRSTGSFASIREMRGYMAVARAGIALARSDTQRTVRMCQQALGYLSEENWRLRGLAAGYLGSAYWERGDAPSAKRALAQAITANEIGGNVYFAISAMCMLALVEFGEGHFTACVRTCDRILRSTTLPGKEMAHRVLGSICRERNDLDAAVSHIEQAITLAAAEHSSEGQALCYLSLAWVQRTRGNWPGLLVALAEIDRLAARHTLSPYTTHAIAMLGALHALADQDLPAASRWARAVGLPLDGEIAANRDDEYAVLARVLLAEGRGEAALAMLERLHAQARAQQRGYAAIEAQALQALALSASGERARALATLDRALALAEPEGIVRLFADEGAPMATLLSRLRETRSSAPAGAPGIAASLDYLDTVLAAAQRLPTRPRSVMSPASLDSLSTREQAVLLLVASGRSNQDIAQELVIALSTVKTHLNHLYAKLGVKSRTQALARAQSLGLLARDIS